MKDLIERIESKIAQDPCPLLAQAREALLEREANNPIFASHYRAEIWQGNNCPVAFPSQAGVSQELTEHDLAVADALAKALRGKGLMQVGYYSVLLTDDHGAVFDEQTQVC